MSELNCTPFTLWEGVKFALPNVFWTRLSGKYGTTFFVKENGLDVAIENAAVEAILVSCLRSEDGYCTSPPPEQGQSLAKESWILKTIDLLRQTFCFGVVSWFSLVDSH
jgi:hypothetical protein